MRALLRDIEDGSLIVISVEHAFYDPGELELYLYNSNDSYKISRIVQSNADALISELYMNGKADFTLYSAEYNPQ